MSSDARKIYGDIIDLEHYVSPDHPQMSRRNRAAQFSPFAALTGYEDLIDEAARETSERTELEEDEKEAIDRQLNLLLQMEDPPAVSITYFVPDDKKTGGEYRTLRGVIRRSDAIGRRITLDTGDVIAIDDIRSVSDGRETLTAPQD